MKKQINPAVGAAIVVGLLLICGWIGYRAINPIDDLGPVPEQYRDRGKKSSAEAMDTRQRESAQRRNDMVAARQNQSSPQAAAPVAP